MDAYEAMLDADLAWALQLPLDFVEKIDPSVRDAYQQLWQAVAEANTDDY